MVDARKWRKQQVEEKLADLTTQPYSEGVLWRMAEQRVHASSRYRKLVDHEYRRLLREAKQALCEEMELVSPA
jgi:hypothetical protein